MTPKLKPIALAIVSAMAINVWGQEAEWEPQSKITGYLAAEADYFPNIHNGERNYGMILSEAGILASYDCTQRLTIKGVFVYRPDLTIDQMVNEANAQWKANDYLNIKVGRFLSPLSPMNTYYYAPVNNSATLPMIISHHEFFPLNMDAVSFNGKVGNDLLFDYDVFAGGYKNSLWLKTGALGFFGTEDQYFSDGSLGSINSTSINSSMSFGGGAHVGIKWHDYITLGLNTMLSAPGEMPASLPTPAGTMDIMLDVDRFAYGLNFKAKYNTLQLLGEVWYTDIDFSNADYNISSSQLVKGTFVELSNSFGKLTPYARYEYHNGLGLNYNRYTTGLNLRPGFETCFKLEYMFYDQKESSDLNGFVASVIYSF